MKGHESTVLVLLQNKADPNLQNKVTSRRVIEDSDVDDDDDNNCDGERQYMGFEYVCMCS